MAKKNIQQTQAGLLAHRRCACMYQLPYSLGSQICIIEISWLIFENQGNMEVDTYTILVMAVTISTLVCGSFMVVKILS